MTYIYIELECGSAAEHRPMIPEVTAGFCGHQVTLHTTWDLVGANMSAWWGHRRGFCFVSTQENTDDETQKKELGGLPWNGWGLANAWMFYFFNPYSFHISISLHTACEWAVNTGPVTAWRHAWLNTPLFLPRHDHTFHAKFENISVLIPGEKMMIDGRW